MTKENNETKPIEILRLPMEQVSQGGTRIDTTFVHYQSKEEERYGRVEVTIGDGELIQSEEISGNSSTDLHNKLWAERRKLIDENTNSTQQ